MEVRMLAQDFMLTPSLREHLERRLRTGFAGMRGRIGSIVVRLRDLNGPRGGRDKVCQVSVTIPGQPDVVIRDVQEDMYYAIDSALKRAAYRTVHRIAARAAKLKPRRGPAAMPGEAADKAPTPG
jgi:ribosome-associated translation inhibitor RaiA